MASKKPTQPPAADITVLLNKVDEVAAKVGVSKLGLGARNLARWKRWIGGEGEYDVSGLRDVVNNNAIMLDNVKDDLDSLNGRELIHYKDLSDDIASLEAKLTERPFPT